MTNCILDGNLNLKMGSDNKRQKAPNFQKWTQWQKVAHFTAFCHGTLCLATFCHFQKWTKWLVAKSPPPTVYNNQINLPRQFS